MSPQARRELLLAGAIRAFAEHGLSATVHADVAKETEVSVPTVFQYFATRELLITEVIGELERFLTELISSATMDSDSAVDALRKMLMDFALAVDANPHYIKLWLCWSSTIAPPTWRPYEAFQDRVLSHLEKIIRNGIASGRIDPSVNVPMAAHAVMGSGQMIAQMKFRSRDDSMVSDFIRTVIDKTLLSK